MGDSAKSVLIVVYGGVVLME